MSDIAIRAGVSRTTVSFVLNDSVEGARIAEETRQRVLVTAAQMGYRRNEMARATASGKSRVIGVVMHGERTEIISQNIAQTLSGVLETIADAGYTPKIIHLPSWGQQEEVNRRIHHASEWRMDGVVAITLSNPTIECLAEESARFAYPVIYIEHGPEKGATVLNTDDRSGLLQSVSHLQNLGHTRIAFVSGTENKGVSNARLNTFRQVMAEFGLETPEPYLLYSHWYWREGMIGPIEQVLSVTPRPTAIIAAADSIAMMIFRAARKCGLEVPDDLSVIGYGNFGQSDFTDPPLASISQPFAEMGELAVRSLLAQLGNSNTGISPAKLEEELILRESTGPAPQS